jgi:hypothetical protein
MMPDPLIRLPAWVIQTIIPIAGQLIVLVIAIAVLNKSVEVNSEDIVDLRQSDLLTADMMRQSSATLERTAALVSQIQERQREQAEDMREIRARVIGPGARP